MLFGPVPVPAQTLLAGAPLTLGTAGHVDHGKTALVGALTGVDTDRLPEERERGLTIVLGYAPLVLPSGRRLSVVDVPGHERFVRTMVSGATGIDGFLLVVAADDGVMPQTEEHAAVLRGLDVTDGVVAITKADLADPARAAAEARALVPDGCEVVACSARAGTGLEELRAALDRLAARLTSRATAAAAPPRLHVDRVFSVAGRGTVVTGTLWEGALAVGDALDVLPAGLPVRVRGLEVHGVRQERAAAGQRVAVNLSGVRTDAVARGDVLAPAGTVAPSAVLDCALALDGAADGERVHVHHGTREAPGRLMALQDDLFQLRLERPLLARDGDRVVVRRSSPPATLGGGVVLEAAARRHGRRPDVLAALARRRDGVPEPAPEPVPRPRATARARRSRARGRRARARGRAARRGLRDAPRGRRGPARAPGAARRRPGRAHHGPPLRARDRRAGRPRDGPAGHRRRGGGDAGAAPRRARRLAQGRPGVPGAPRRGARDAPPPRRPPRAPTGGGGNERPGAAAGPPGRRPARGLRSSTRRMVDSPRMGR
jgi:selenocysteine-specific elongation factor